MSSPPLHSLHPHPHPHPHPLPPQPPTQQRHYAAGILPITWHGSTALFLVGKDLRDESYSDFGGRVERVDENSPVSTAVREWYEETLGVVLTAKALRTRMHPSNCLCLRSRTQNGHPYYMYVVEVPFAPHLRNAFHKTLNFLKYRNLHKVYVEKTDVRWVTLQTMLDDLPKRAVFASTVKQHRDLLEKIVRRRDSWGSTCTEHASSHEYYAGIKTRRFGPPDSSSYSTQ